MSIPVFYAYLHCRSHTRKIIPVAYPYPRVGVYPHMCHRRTIGRSWNKYRHPHNHITSCGHAACRGRSQACWPIANCIRWEVRDQHLSTTAARGFDPPPQIWNQSEAQVPIALFLFSFSFSPYFLFFSFIFFLLSSTGFSSSALSFLPCPFYPPPLSLSPPLSRCHTPVVYLDVYLEGQRERCKFSQ